MRSPVVAVLLVTACASQGQPSVTGVPSATPVPVIRYVALGDSYTIGTGVASNDRWPDQLVRRLSGEGISLELVANLGVNGYTSADLIADQLPELADLQPDFVTILVGVNDAVQRVPTNEYRASVALILDAVLGEVGRQGVLVVSTPDYTRTPRGADFGPPEAQRAAIADLNRIMGEETGERGIAFVDIGQVADEAGTNPDLVAADKLHPSGVQYGRWVDLIEPVAERLLTGTAD